jgi:hypothetical protein
VSIEAKLKRAVAKRDRAHEKADAELCAVVVEAFDQGMSG